MIDDSADQPLLIRNSYFDRRPQRYRQSGIEFVYHHHTFADLYMALVRTSYRVDLILEPEPIGSGPRSQWWREAFHLVPRTLIVRARKEGN